MPRLACRPRAMQECRICLSEEPPLRSLGCKCMGTLGLAHAACAGRWFTDRGRTVCEICQSPVVLRTPWPMAPYVLCGVLVAAVMATMGALCALGILWLIKYR